MLMSLPQLIAEHDLRIDGVIHAGAHLAEEADVYRDLGVGSVWWIEANPGVLDTIRARLQAFPGQELIHALIYDRDDAFIDFNVTNYAGMSSSILPFGTHPQFSPDTVFVEHLKAQRTSTLDTLTDRYGMRANLLNMDLQGAELHALRGARRLVDEQIRYVFSEVNVDEVYVGCAKVHELDAFLVGFERVATHWVDGQGWGDALYVRR